MNGRLVWTLASLAAALSTACGESDGSQGEEEAAPADAGTSDVLVDDDADAIDDGDTAYRDVPDPGDADDTNSVDAAADGDAGDISPDVLPECTESSDCDAPADPCRVASCEAGSCVESDAPSGSDCDVDGGGLCDGAGACVGCLDDAACDSPDTCDDGRCVPPPCQNGVRDGAETDVDCGGTECGQCGVTEMCLVASDCETLFCAAASDRRACAACSEDANCGDGFVCDLESGACFADPCLVTECASPPSPVCVENQVYSYDTPGACVRFGRATSCSYDSSFTVDCDEIGTLCVDGACAAGCAGDLGCAEGFVCIEGLCVEVADNGAACSEGAQCASGSCVDEFCCDSACAGTCRSCDQPGVEGTCTDLPYGVETADECGGPDTCNGRGECTRCGDGVIDAGEFCDNADLGGQSCATQGFRAGTLSCAADCMFDTARCSNEPWSENFESGALGPEWVLGGDVFWLASASAPIAGSYSGQSGHIYHSQSSSMQVTLNFAEAGTVQFNYRVSSEASFDYLNLFVDDVLRDRWSGNALTPVTRLYPITPGVHTLRWTYSKDESVSANADTAWIDDIVTTSGFLP